MVFASTDLEHILATGLIAGYEFHSEIGSTSDRAAELVNQPRLACPFLVLAERQTAGRGRGSNWWWSTPGGLTFSLVLDARQCGLAVERWPLVALATGLAVCDAIERQLPAVAVRLKWPNDVYVAGRKACGILVEAPGVSPARLIVGIGINVNNAFTAAPPELQQLGTALIDVTGRTCELPTVLLAVLERLNFELSALRDDQRDVLGRWRSRCLLTGKRVELSLGTGRVVGICHGIDDEGRLLLLTERGVEAHRSGTIDSFDR